MGGAQAVCCSSLLVSARSKTVRKRGQMQHPRAGRSNDRQDGDGIKLKKGRSGSGGRGGRRRMRGMMPKRMKDDDEEVEE